MNCFFEDFNCVFAYLHKYAAYLGCWSAYPVTICESSGTESDEEVDLSELCCVCGHWKPKELQNIYVLVIPKWAQCDGMKGGMPCKHWVHISQCFFSVLGEWWQGLSKGEN